jgi:hypothetical protein
MRQPAQDVEDVLCDVNLPASTFLNMMSILQDVSVALIVYTLARIKQFHTGL